METKLDFAAKTTYFLERFRDEHRWTQQAMADILGVSISTYKRAITQETIDLDLYKIYSFCVHTGISMSEVVGEEIPAARLLHCSRIVSDSSRKFLEGIADVEAALATRQGNSKWITKMVPTGVMKDGMLIDSADYIEYETDCQQATCAIEVTSEHLRPTYVKGDVLLIRQDPPGDGDTGVFVNVQEGRAYLRKFILSEPCRLEPINHYGEVLEIPRADIDDPTKWIKFGYVLTKAR